MVALESSRAASAAGAGLVGPKSDRQTALKPGCHSAGHRQPAVRRIDRRENDGAIHYGLASADQEALVQRPEDAYRAKPAVVRRLIMHSPKEKLRTCADASRIVKDLGIAAVLPIAICLLPAGCHALYMATPHGLLAQRHAAHILERTVLGHPDAQLFCGNLRHAVHPRSGSSATAPRGHASRGGDCFCLARSKKQTDLIAIGFLISCFFFLRYGRRMRDGLFAAL